jgi:hypothetical protein
MLVRHKKKPYNAIITQPHKFSVHSIIGYQSLGIRKNVVPTYCTI